MRLIRLLRWSSAGFLLGFLVGVGPSCGPSTPAACSVQNCGGCCDTGGNCQNGSSPLACGANGATCATCGVGAACVQGACVTGPDAGPDSGAGCNSGNCPSGCCSGGQCYAGTGQSFCGTAGNACAACGTGQTCAAGHCITGSACTAQSCANGCCNNSGTCISPETSAACGLNGVACQVCTSPSTCVNGTCTGGDAGCNTGNCPNGCCAAGVCTKPTDFQCGTQGATCANCNTASKYCGMGSETCTTAGSGAYKSACSSDGQCQAITGDPWCFPNGTGFCEAECDSLGTFHQCSTSGADYCLGDLGPLDAGDYLGQCLPHCNSVNDCASTVNFNCDHQFGNGNGYCLPKCTTAANCVAWFHDVSALCQTGTGQCCGVVNFACCDGGYCGEGRTCSAGRCQ